MPVKKVCTLCLRAKFLEEFATDNKGGFVVKSKCRECSNIRHREELKNPLYLKHYENANKKYVKTLRGFVMNMYHNMKVRATGVDKRKKHLFKDKSIMSKADFYALAKLSNTFIELYKQYKKSGMPLKLAPIARRVNTDRGYTKENIKFMTHSESSRLAAKDKWAKWRKNARKV